MIRIFGAIMIVAASALTGAYLNSRLCKRGQYLEALIAALEHLKTHICFLDCTMEQALISADGVCDTCGIFLYAAENMKDMGIKDAWKRAVDEKKDKMCLSSNDAAAIASLGIRLGATDSEDQRKNIDNVISVLKLQSEEARRNYQKNGRIYRSCGVLFGALAALVLL